MAMTRPRPDHGPAPTRLARRLAVVAVFAGALGHPGLARADDAALAKREFAAGKAAEQQRDWTTAAEHFRRAYQASPHPFSLYNVAANLERAGKLRSAVEYYQRYLAEAGDAADEERVLSTIAGLQRRPSPLEVETDPAGATILVDGSPVGKAPLTRSLAPGIHQVAATSGTLTVSRHVTAEYGEPITLRLTLRADQGTLTIDADVVGARVEVDGVFLGVTPFTSAVAPGRRVIRISADGFPTIERTVDVRVGQAARQDVTFRARPAVPPPPGVRPEPGGSTRPGTAGDPHRRRTTFSVDGGLALAGVGGGFAQLGAGVRGAFGEYAFRFGYRAGEDEFGDTAGGFSYGGVFRLHLGPTRIHPFAAVAIDVVSGSALAGLWYEAQFGLLVGNLLGKPPLGIDLQLGVGVGRLKAADATRTAFPISVGLVFHPR